MRYALTLFGWDHIVLSNHVPELPQILDHLGIRDKFARITNSAVTGYEKPHPQSYIKAIEGLSGIDDLWMIGDSILADFEGAKAVGWKAILVRQTAYVTPTFQTLSEVVKFLNI
ncbi:MAG TPA: HAD-IA family hydrolase [Verrucomicrobiae bacterium]